MPAVQEMVMFDEQAQVRHTHVPAYSHPCLVSKGSKMFVNSHLHVLLFDR